MAESQQRPKAEFGDCAEGRPQQPRSLRINISWSVLGSVVHGMSQFGLLVALAKLGSPDMVGQFALGLAVVTPIFALLSLRLRTLQITDAKQDYDLRDYLGLRLATSVLALAVVAVIALRFDFEMCLLILALGASQAVESIRDVFQGQCQQAERMDKIACSRILQAPLTLLSISAGVLLTGSVACGVVCTIFARTAVLALYDIPTGASILSRKVSATILPRFQPDLMVRLSWLALPVGLVAAAASLTLNLPRYFVAHYCDLAHVGLLAAIAYAVFPFRLLMDATQQSATPRVARHFAQGQMLQLRGLIRKYFALAGTCGAAGIFAVLVLGRPTLAALFGQEYAHYHSVFAWFMVAVAIRFVGRPNLCIIRATRNFWRLFALRIVELAFAAMCCSMLIPRSGVLGASHAVLATSVFSQLLTGLVALALLRRLSSRIPIRNQLDGFAPTSESLAA